MIQKIRYVSLGLLVAAAMVSAGDAIRGRRIEAMREVIDSPSHSGRDRLLADWERNHGEAADGSPPEALALAALWIDQAAASPPALRSHALARAEALLDRVRMLRPEAPSASLLAVRADLVRHGRPTHSALSAYARSYRQAGFLRGEGLWRLAFAATYWSVLSDKTRGSVINEAVWLVHVDGHTRPMVDQLVTGTPLALPVELRLIS